MAQIEKYVLEDERGAQSDDWFDDLNDVRIAAGRSNEPVAVVRLVFEYSDSELVEVWRNGQRTSEDVWSTDGR